MAGVIVTAKAAAYPQPLQAIAAPVMDRKTGGSQLIHDAMYVVKRLVLTV
jgi:hypothetical protein